MIRPACLGVPAILTAVFLAACQPYQYKATILRPPKPLNDFSLAASDGSQFTLSQFQDRLVILYFGYTNCPDVCPATLTQLKVALQQLGPDANTVQVAFVTVDPTRDTPDRLKSYLASFSPSFIGLRTEDTSELNNLAGQFGIYYEIGTATEQAAQVLVNHTSSILVVRKMGLVAVFPPDSAGGDVAADLRQLLKSQ